MNNKAISRSISVLVLAVSIIAFVLSYNALREVAANNGLADWRAYFWPLLIDFPLVVFSLAVLWANLNQMSARWPWFLVGLFTAATITFNLIHAPDTLIARSVAVVAPLALFLSFETLVGMIRNEIKRGRASKSLEELDTHIAEQRKVAETLKNGIGNLKVQREKLTAEIDALQQEQKRKVDEKPKGSVTSQDKIDKARVILHQRESEGLPLLSGAELGRQLGVSRTAGNLIKRELISQNENGKAIA